MNGQSIFPTATRGVFQDIFDGIGDAIGGVVGGITAPVLAGIGGIIGNAPAGLIQVGPGGTITTPQQTLVPRSDEISGWDKFTAWVTDSYGWAWLLGGVVVISGGLWLIFRRPAKRFVPFRRYRKR